MGIMHADELHVHSTRKSALALNLGRMLLPSRRKGIDKNHEVRIAHRNRCSPCLPGRDAKHFLITNLRLPHRDFKVISTAGARGEGASFNASPGANAKSLAAALGTKIGGHAARAV